MIHRELNRVFPSKLKGFFLAISLQCNLTCCFVAPSRSMDSVVPLFWDLATLLRSNRCTVELTKNAPACCIMGAVFFNSIFTRTLPGSPVLSFVKFLLVNNISEVIRSFIRDLDVDFASNWTWCCFTKFSNDSRRDTKSLASCIASHYGMVTNS